MNYLLKIKSASICLFLIYICTWNGLKADSTSMPKSRLELLFNVSNTISRFAANGAVKPVFEEPFLIGLKISNKTKKSALRIGVNFSVSQTTDDLTDVSRSSTINSWAPLIGFELRKSLGYNFEFYGGCDARYYNELNKTESIELINGNQVNTQFKTTQIGSGFGPFFGIIYNITPRISIQTEGNLYVNFIRKKREFSISNAAPEVFEDKSVSSLSPNAPSALFLVIRF